MSAPVIHGDPLTMEAVADFMEAVRKSVELADEDQRHGPRQVFMASAEIAGFTEAQASFMWNFMAAQHRRMF